MTYLKAFIAGYFATLLFHQGLLALLFAAGVSPRPAFAMTPTDPFGLPAVLSLAFWGGVWGVVIWRWLASVQGAAYWRRAVIIGALAPSAVALLIVFPLKGLGVAGGGDPRIIVGALLLNGAWGLGVAALMRMMGGASTATDSEAASP